MLTTGSPAAAANCSATQAPPMEKRLTAVGHPLRIAILGALQEGDEPLSPRQIATILDESLGNVSYHVRALEDLGCLVLVDWRKVRGAVQHFYRPTISATFDRDCVCLRPADPMPVGISLLSPSPAASESLR